MTNTSSASGAPVFGRRGAPVAARPATQNRFEAAPDYAAAKAALKSGKPPHWTRHGPITLGVASLGALALAGAMALTYAGDLARDARLAGTWTPAPDWRVLDGHCTSYEHVITLCHATLMRADEQTIRVQEARFLMSFSSGDGEFLAAVRSTKDPEAISIGYAAEDKLVNRVVTFVLSFLTLIGGALSGALRLAAGRYKGGRAHRELMAGIVAMAGPQDSGEAA